MSIVQQVCSPYWLLFSNWLPIVLHSARSSRIPIPLLCNLVQSVAFLVADHHTVLKIGVKKVLLFKLIYQLMLYKTLNADFQFSACSSAVWSIYLSHFCLSHCLLQNIVYRNSEGLFQASCHTQFNLHHIIRYCFTSSRSSLLVLLLR